MASVFRMKHYKPGTNYKHIKYKRRKKKVFIEDQLLGCQILTNHKLDG